MEVPIIGSPYRTQGGGSFFINSKEDYNEKVTRFVNKMKAMKKNVRIFCSDNADENSTLRNKMGEMF